MVGSEIGPEAARLAGKPCRIDEPEHGPIEIPCHGPLLPLRLFHDENLHVRQGAIVEADGWPAV
jgi:hypothetical protein